MVLRLRLHLFMPPIKPRLRNTFTWSRSIAQRSFRRLLDPIPSTTFVQWFFTMAIMSSSVVASIRSFTPSSVVACTRPLTPPRRLLGWRERTLHPTFHAFQDLEVLVNLSGALSSQLQPLSSEFVLDNIHNHSDCLGKNSRHDILRSHGQMLALIVSKE